MSSEFLMVFLKFPFVFFCFKHKKMQETKKDTCVCDSRWMIKDGAKYRRIKQIKEK